MILVTIIEQKSRPAANAPYESMFTLIMYIFQLSHVQPQRQPNSTSTQVGVISWTTTAPHPTLPTQSTFQGTSRQHSKLIFSTQPYFDPTR
jgi:hypothetical protein